MMRLSLFRGSLQRYCAVRTFSCSIASNLPKVTFVLGPPGAGKSTQAQMLAKEFGLQHLSAGELLRTEQLSGSSDGVLIDQTLKDGKIVPVKITLSLLRKAMEKSNSHWYVIDGFPRNLDNLQGWQAEMTDVCEVDSIMFIDSPQNILEDRLILRGKSSGRSDDNIDSIRKRFTTYVDSSLPIIQHYKSKGQLIHVSGLGDVHDVYQSAKLALLPRLEADIIQMTARLLDAIDHKDMERYEYLCAKDITCFEPEARGQLVEGWDFHRYYLNNNHDRTNSVVNHQSVSTMTSPVVRMMGTCAVITYGRVQQCRDKTTGESFTQIFEETRVWQLQQLSLAAPLQQLQRRWQCVHFHRSIPVV